MIHYSVPVTMHLPAVPMDHQDLAAQARNIETALDASEKLYAASLLLELEQALA